jgi:transposase
VLAFFKALPLCLVGFEACGAPHYWAREIRELGDKVRLMRGARHLAAWTGLVPRQHSSGGKPRQGGISEQDDRYLRRLLVLGATAVAQANKTARIVRALLVRGEANRMPAAAPGGLA